MDKKKISKDYLEKIKLLEAYNKNYYDNNSPIISDQEYDFFKIFRWCISHIFRGRF